MKGTLKKILAVGLAGTMAAGMLAGCGSSTGGSGSTDEEALSFTYIISAAENTSFYTEYEDHPIMMYWLDQEWDVDGETVKIDIDFSSLPSGSERDTMNTLMATGEYSDVMPMTYSSDGAAALYENGIALDLTELVEQYMPNYMQWMEDHPEYADRLYNVIDGEKKIIQLYGLGDEAEAPFCGWLYRRDWIVKYGTNPETGEAFTGGWQDEDKTEWSDDVVFPSGGTDPIYISDWEWMCEIFEKALAAEGISDGYAMQIYYTGDETMGGLTSTFCEGGNSYYYLDENGECQYGFDQPGYYNYATCLNTWYKNGWLQKSFDENTSDIMFWKVDTANVYSGKVGMWYGMVSSFGNMMDTNSGDYTDGICAYGANYPINDVYGDESEQGYTPTCYYANSIMTTSYIITEKAADKNLGALLTAIDWLYGDEGGLMHARGFSKDQQAEIQDEFYIEHGMDDGAWWYEEIDGEQYIVLNPACDAEDGLRNAATGLRVAGKNVNSNLDLGYNQVGRRALVLWGEYPCSGNITSDVSGQLDTDTATETSANTVNIRTYISTELPNLITGRTELNEANWQTFVDGIMDYDPDLYKDAINEVLGK